MGKILSKHVISKYIIILTKINSYESGLILNDDDWWTTRDNTQAKWEHIIFKSREGRALSQVTVCPVYFYQNWANFLDVRVLGPVLTRTRSTVLITCVRLIAKLVSCNDEWVRVAWCIPLWAVCDTWGDRSRSDAEVSQLDARDAEASREVPWIWR